MASFFLSECICIYAMSYKIGLTECRKAVIFDGITSNLVIIHYRYVAVIVLVIVFSIAWCEIVMQCSLLVHHRIYQLSLMNFPGRYIHLMACVCTKKTQVARGIFYGIPVESIT